MAIRSFKDIIDNKAYRISSKDRDIFEQGSLQSFFGFSDSDLIEFVLFDANDNQLPQGRLGSLVRYIPLSSNNIRDYFMIADGTKLQALNFPSEYFIDVAKLTREAGYQNGIFKVQITLINRRIGSESINDKLWVAEISPSKTELKLLPLRSGKNPNQGDLLNRFRIFVDNGGFRSDIIYQINQFIESVTIPNVVSFIKDTYGNDWLLELKNEYYIQDVDLFLERVYLKFCEAMQYEFSNRVSDITDINYGKPKQYAAPLQLNRNDVMSIAQRILVQCVDVNLVTRGETAPTPEFVNTVIKSRSIDVVVQNNTAIIEAATKTKNTSGGSIDLDAFELNVIGNYGNLKQHNPVKIAKRE